MFTPTAQVTNIVQFIACLHDMIGTHLREISYCREELLLCITDSSFDATDREALKLQIQTLRAEVAQWRAEIRHYREQYASLSSARSVPIAAHHRWDAA